MLYLGNHYKGDILARKEFQLIESANANRYQWVVAEVVWTRFLLNIIEVVTKADITIRDLSN